MSACLVYIVSLSLVEESHNNTRENIYVVIQIPNSSRLSELIAQDKRLQNIYILCELIVK